VLRFDRPVNRTGAPQDESRIQNYFTPVPNTRHQITNTQMNFSSGHSSNQEKEKKGQYCGHILIFTFYIIRTDKRWNPGPYNMHCVDTTEAIFTFHLTARDKSITLSTQEPPDNMHCADLIKASEFIKSHTHIPGSLLQYIISCSGNYILRHSTREPA